MTWTQKPPEEEGYYWCRDPSDDSVEIVEVWRPTKNGFVVGETSMPVEEQYQGKAFWFGPLREPPF